MFSAIGASISSDAGRLRADRDLFHVHDVGRAIDRAAFGQRDDRNRIRHALRQQPRAVDRIDRDVHLRLLAVADALADVEHRRFVFFAFADDHDAVHLR